MASSSAAPAAVQSNGTNGNVVKRKERCDGGRQAVVTCFCGGARAQLEHAHLQPRGLIEKKMKKTKTLRGMIARQFKIGARTQLPRFMAACT